MKFRNFDNIGLKTKNEIKQFLGDIWFEQLRQGENSLRITLERDWKVREINPNIDLENIVCLINDSDKYDKILLCIIQPGLKRGEDDRIETCYCLQASNRLMVKDFKAEFQTQKEACEMVDGLYGLSSCEEISAKLCGEDESE